MTFEEFLEKRNLTPENTPGSEHALMQEAYDAGYEAGKLKLTQEMTALQKTHLSRIADISDAIFTVAKSLNESETECIKTLSLLIDEEIEKIQKEDKK